MSAPLTQGASLSSWRSVGDDACCIMSSLLSICCYPHEYTCLLQSAHSAYASAGLLSPRDPVSHVHTCLSHKLHILEASKMALHELHCIDQLTRAFCKLEVIAPLLVMKGMPL